MNDLNELCDQSDFIKRLTVRFRILQAEDFDDVFTLVRSCYTKDFYEIAETSRYLYKKVANSGYSIGAFYDDKLIGILLGCFSSDEHFKYLQGDMPEEFINLDMEGAFELMSSCVDKRFRGMHLERDMTRYILDNVSASWYWCTAHKDNVPSIKCILSNGFKLAKENCTFHYPHKTIYNRNLYFRKH